ncbi:MAG TPA: rhomboid family intramembrane serine protease [Polyangia bacterium]|nr:rhomboid family intramembrane serine protease [Polyangia bacterium]
MRKPPSLTQLPRFPATGGTALLALVTSLVGFAYPDRVDHFTIDGRALHGEPWRFLTAVLPHGGVLHLAFNLYWLWVFGTLVEERLGHFRTLALFLLFAAGSVAAEYALFASGIGLSGVGYGLFGMLWMLSSRDRRFADAVDTNTIGLFLIWGVGCAIATALHVMAVANAAHAMGLMLGVAVGLAMSANPAWWAAVAGLCALSAAGATIARPHVNLDRARAAQGEAWAGQQLRDAGKTDRALALFRAAATLDLKYVIYVCDIEHELGDGARAFADCMRGCDGGEPDACSKAGVLAELGENGAAADAELGQKLLTRGCDGHDAWGCANLGRYYEVSDPARAAKLYAEGCSGGIRFACDRAKTIAGP